MALAGHTKPNKRSSRWDIELSEASVIVCDRSLPQGLAAACAARSVQVLYKEGHSQGQHFAQHCVKRLPGV
jgi:hypothetical protein